jgi:hypothetical protein
MGSGMDQRSVRIVVGRGDPSGADIRATLEDDGFQVVGEASSVEDLARLVQANPPDVVVLDDTIGVAAAQAVQELAPEAKLVVIWPAAVLPIAGATRIDATDLHTELVPAVAAAVGALLTGFTTIDRPEWIDTVRKDPATLREMLDAKGGVPARPSVTELQRPHGYLAPSTGWRRRKSTGSVAAASVAAGAAAAGSDTATADEDATVNRRLGIIALGGAVAAGALMIALSFGSSTPSVVTAEPFVPGVHAPSDFIPDPASGGTTDEGPGGTHSGGNSGPGAIANGGAGATNSGTGTTTGGSGTITSGTPTIGSGTTGGGSNGGDIRTVTHPSANGPGTSHGGGTDGTGTDGTGTDGTGTDGTGTDGTGTDGTGTGGGPQTPTMPGNSGDHNPHGGPPGQTEDHPTRGNSGTHPSHPSHPMAHAAHQHKR